MSEHVLTGYVVGNTLLHRLPAGLKLFALTAGSAAAILFRSPLSTTLCLALTCALIALAGFRSREIGKVLAGFLLIGILLFVFSVLQNGFWEGYAVVGTLLSLLFWAVAVVRTTKTEAMLDVFVRVLRPLRFLGVNPEKVAFAFSLTIRMIPEIFRIERQTREASRARGLERSVRARTFPLIIRTVAYSLATGEAIAARGILDD